MKHLANLTTSLRVIAAPIVIFLILQNSWTQALIVTIAAFSTDYLDGLLSRKFNSTSKFGMTFDPIADKIICLSIIWTIAVSSQHTVYLILAAIFTAYDLSTTTMRLTKTKPMPASKKAKCKTALLMIGLTVFMLGQITSLIAITALANTLITISAITTFISLKSYIKRQKPRT